MSNKLSYFHRLSKGSINYGPLELKVTTEKQRETSIEVFEFCHEQNSSSTEFSMTNEVSVSGVLKAFDIGASHSNTFATTSTKATQEGKEIKTYEREFVSEKVELTRTVKEDQFLAHYVLVDLYCFTVNGGERQYAHVPRSDVLIEPLDEEEMGKISRGTFLMEKASWEVVTSRYPGIQLDDIPTLARQLTPLDIKQAPSFPPVGKIDIRSYSSRNYLDGRNKSHREVFMTNRNPVGDKYLHWTIESVDGNYAIKSVSSGNYLDGRNSSYASRDGAVWVTNRNPKGDKYLQWKIESVDGRYALKSVSSGLYLDGRNPNHLGNKVWLTGRNPQGDKYLQWTFSGQK